MNTKDKVKKYINDWRLRDYGEDIPDEVPDILMSMNLAPSYKQIALAVLKNDMHMESLGFSAPQTKWYSEFKRIEIDQRDSKRQQDDNSISKV